MGFIKNLKEDIGTYVLAAVPAICLSASLAMTTVGVETVGDYAVRRNDNHTSIYKRLSHSSLCGMYRIDNSNDGSVDKKYVVCMPGRFIPSVPMHQPITPEDNQLLDDIVSQLDR